MKKVTFIFIFLLFFKGVSAITFFEDSTKVKYKLNDPRNPNCPCHKYQKLADEEFRKLNKNNNPVILSGTEGGLLVSANPSNNSNVKTKHFKNITKLHRRNKTYKIFNFNIGHRGKKKYFLRNNKNVSSCFHWK